MNFGGSRGQLDDAQQVARAHWNSACDTWNDDARRRHETEIVQPLDDAVSEVLRAVDRLITVFANARRECGFGDYS